MKGLQEQGVIAVAKQFPTTFGKLTVDSATIFEMNRLDTSALQVHRQLADQGLLGMLTSHFHFSMDGKKKPVAAALSSSFVTDVLRTQLGFQGLLFAEIPILRQISGNALKGEMELLALQIGNDVLVNPQNLAATVKRITKALKKDSRLRQNL